MSSRGKEIWTNNNTGCPLLHTFSKSILNSRLSQLLRSSSNQTSKALGACKHPEIGVILYQDKSLINPRRGTTENNIVPQLPRIQAPRTTRELKPHRVCLLREAPACCHHSNRPKVEWGARSVRAKRCSSCCQYCLEKQELRSHEPQLLSYWRH